MTKLGRQSAQTKC